MPIIGAKMGQNGRSSKCATFKYIIRYRGSNQITIYTDWNRFKGSFD